MELFVKSKLPLVNKFSYIKITIGKKLDESIFDGNLNNNYIKNFFKKIHKLDKKIKFKKYLEKTYNNMNDKIVLIEKNIDYYIVNHNNTILLDNMMLCIETIEKNRYIIPSVNNYNNIENNEVLEINIGQLFNIYIKCANEKYLLEIVIIKPNDVEHVINTLKKII